VASFLLTEIFRNNSAFWYLFSSLSESGFIPTFSGFRIATGNAPVSSHLFQRVASFLQGILDKLVDELGKKFSSLSESGFIPTNLS